MARRDALLRLHKTLLSRRGALRKALAGELADLRNKAESGDAADVAFDSGSEEISTQLAELEARELSQIERALARMKQGIYGVCEHCQCKIPVARLNALPYSTTCIECQREMEHYPGWAGGRGGADWEKVYDAGTSPDEEREVNISEIEMDLSSH
ncbi:MAG: TraR/DksA family transcriptional regulator [Planctomycetota bacterium]|jgi:DnaK suppressor protein|nr:MAG: TraR/DksA family transcriptional regulator [Planctomycetota bacterium]